MFELVFYGVIAAVALGIMVPRYLRTQKALREPIGGDQCVACQSTQVTTFAPDCYRCDGCGFQWGDGMAQHAAQQRAAQVQRLGPEERKAYIRSELNEAQAHLSAAAPLLEHAGKQLGADVLVGGGFGTGDMYSRNRTEGMVQAARELGLAQKRMSNAAAAHGYATQAESFDVGGPLLAFDTFFDSFVVDALNHGQVTSLKDKHARMSQIVAQAKQALDA